jgi:hypothetical protein
MIYLPDVNVWIALASDRHVHHQVAKVWFSSIQTNKAAFCRITEMGFLRLLTNRNVMGGDTLSPQVAWEVYDALRADPQIVFLQEIPEVVARWRAISAAASGGPNMWTDAYLSALASAFQSKACHVRPSSRSLSEKSGDGKHFGGALKQDIPIMFYGQELPTVLSG